MSYKVLIVDDEELARDSIRILLKDDPECEIVGESDNGLDATKKITELKPDIVFLDIQMPNSQGFEVIEKLQMQSPVFVMVTAFDQYAIKAFDLNAVDYLLKPYSDSRFKQSLSKAKSRVSLKNSQSQLEILKNAIQGLTTQNSDQSRLVIKSAGKYQFVNTSDIQFIKASGNYCEIHSVDKKHLMYTSISELEKSLDSGQFRRIHRSSIVNIHCIKELESHFNGEFIVHLESGVKLKLSRSYKDALDIILNA